MKRGLNYFLFFAAAFLIVILINSFSPAPTFTYQKEKCTRYCHNNGCPHFDKKMGEVKLGSLRARAIDFYWWNIGALKNNPFGLSYKAMNILVYVIGFPLLTIGLAYMAFRKKKL